MAVIKASAGVAAMAEHEAARFVIAHAGLGRRVVIGRNRAETGVLRSGKPADLAASLGWELADLTADPLALIDRHGVLVARWNVALLVTRSV